jgi:uncharacterized protein YbjT (DUF2867 family)
VRVLSRRAHDSTDGTEYVIGDLAKDDGIAAAVDGAAVVVHCAGSGKIDDESAQIGNLIQAAQRAGVHHLLNWEEFLAEWTGS